MVRPFFSRSCQSGAGPQTPISSALDVSRGPTHGALSPRVPCSCSSHEPRLQKSCFSLGAGEKQKSPVQVSISAGNSLSPRSQGLPFGQRLERIAAHLEGRRSQWWEGRGGCGQVWGTGRGKQLSIRCSAVLMRSIHRQRCPGGVSCFRMELGGLDIPKRGALAWRRVSGYWQGRVGYVMQLLLSPCSPQEYHKNCREGLLGAWPGVANWPFASWIWLSDVFCLACTMF